MTPTTIRLLSEQRFATFIRWLASNGQANDAGGLEATCIATLQHPESGQPKAFYVKFYPDLNLRSRAMANEVAGYVLAHRYGLPQPPRACIARIPLKKLDLKSLPKRHQWLKEVAKSKTNYHAFCTEAMSAPTPWHHYGEAAFEAMKEDIRLWPDHAKTLAFDNIVANLDRHLNNLLHIGESRYALIDHGRLVVESGHWQASDLKAEQEFNNRLLEILYSDPTEAANGMIAAAENATALLTGTAEVSHWIDHLTQSQEESRAFDKFVQARTISAPQRIAKRYALC